MTILLLRQKGLTALADEIVEAVDKHPELQVLDRTAKMLRVEGDGRHLRDIADQYQGLEVSEERSYGEIGQPRPMARGLGNREPDKR
jgi:hypothetical protein